MAAPIVVNFDKTKHLSERELKKRYLLRRRILKEEDAMADEKKRRIEEEERRIEEDKLKEAERAKIKEERRRRREEKVKFFLNILTRVGKSGQISAYDRLQATLFCFFTYYARLHATNVGYVGYNVV